ncbi:MAG: hypothetical protein JXA89_18445 [Anaerolineae bacterium]|nr:hypothetical protein [Anaerolineae bacterium]
MNQDGPKDQDNELNNLPDWLRQMAGAKETPDWLLRLSLESAEIPGAAVSPAMQPRESGEPALAGQDMSDWFADDQIEPSDQQEQQEPEEVPDWFQGIADLDQEPEAGTTTDDATQATGTDVFAISKDETMPDWLTGVSTQSDAQESESEAASLADQKSIPDWLVGSSQEKGQEQPVFSPIEEAVPDWLTGTGDQDISEELETIIEPPDQEAGIPSWLIGATPTRQEEPPVLAPEKEAQESAPDWLTQDSEPEAEGAPDWVSQDSELEAEGAPDWVSQDSEPEAEGTPDWLTQDSEPEAESTPDWLAGISDQVVAEQPEPASAPSADESGLPDWLLAGIGEEEAEEAPVFAPAEKARDDMPSWLAQDDEAEAEGAPDWLAGISDQAETEAHEPATASPEKEAALPDWLAGISDQTATEIPEPATTLSAEETELPDWLTGIGEAEVEEPPVLASVDKEIEKPAWLADIDEEEIAEPEPTPPAPTDEKAEQPDWLAGIEEPEQEGALDWLAGIEEPEPATAPSGQTAGMPDWFADIDETETGQDLPDWLADIDEQAVAEEPEPTSLSAGGETAQQDALDELAKAEEIVPEADESDWITTVGQETEEKSVPDWLVGVDLDHVGEDQAETEQIAFDSYDQDSTPDRLADDGEPKDESAPDWLQDIRAGTEQEIAPTQDATAWLQDVTETPVPQDEAIPEIASPSDQLPDWLQQPGMDEIDTGEQVLATESEEALPDWLDGADFAESEVDADFLKEVMAAEPTTGQGARPVETPFREPPTKAAVPASAATLSWIERLRAQAGTPIDKESPAETSGPLSGLRGLLGPEPILAILPRSEYKPIPSMPESHQAEAKLFEQVLALPADRPVAITQAPGQLVLASLGRWVLYLALVVVIVAAAFLPDSGSLVSAPEMAETAAFYNTVQSLPPESTALLVLDYDPSLDGELTPSTRAIVRHLLHNQVGIVAVSFTPQGVAIVQDLFQESTGSDSGEYMLNLGYLPPHPASLHAFVGNPVSGTTLFGEKDPAQTALGKKIAGFDSLNLVITVSGNQEHIRWWIEQIGSQYDINIVSAVSSSIAPFIQPYYAADQIKGLLIGLAGAAGYETKIAQVALDYAQNNLVLQAYGQLLLVAILVLGGITFFARGRK